MNIDRVQVKGLFGRFDHDLKFTKDERIMIVSGPNGFGKTTTLRLIDALFNRSSSTVAAMPFNQVEVTFDDGRTLTVTKHEDTEVLKPDHLPVTLALHSARKAETFNPPRVSVDSAGLPLDAIEDLIPLLNRIGRNEWRNLRTGEILNLEEVLTDFEDELPPSTRRASSESPRWLQEVRNSVMVRFIDTERLTGTPAPRRSRRRLWEDRPTRTVRQYSNDLSDRVSRSIKEYGSVSQSLDRTFPARLVADSNGQNGPMSELRANLNAIEQKRSRLEHAGLLSGEQSHISIPDLEEVDESRRGVLTVYAQDAEKKLAVFDDLYERVDTFTGIANSRFHHKQVAVGAKGLSVVGSDGANLDLEMLSSGEQHELVILYELIFRTPEDSLVLIDEPELSLHVAWQEQFVPDLERMAKLSHFRAILATHSPEMIGDRWDLTVGLRGPNAD